MLAEIGNLIKKLLLGIRIITFYILLLLGQYQILITFFVALLLQAEVLGPSWDDSLGRIINIHIFKKI